MQIEMEGLKFEYTFYANEVNIFQGSVDNTKMCMCHFKLKIINFLWKKSKKLNEKK